jgi:hypothetical protein
MGRPGRAGLAGFRCAGRWALKASEVAMMLLGMGAIYLVIGALFATIVVPLLAIAAMVAAVIGFTSILL